MSYTFSWTAFGVFAFFVGGVLGLSFWLGRKGQTAKGYYAAHGQIHWFVNGVAFAGDYLSAASFLGICGMIAFFGYDGFLYSIGYLAGWVVALFVIAEPLKRLGKFTFADALDAKFNSRGIKLAAAVSTLVVSIFYLIPQMVGAGVLVQPLLGFSHLAGVVIVGVVVILIVVTAGMVSTTWVQFIKGSLLVVFCLGLTVMILRRGLTTRPDLDAAYKTSRNVAADAPVPALKAWAEVIPADGGWVGKPYVRVQDRAPAAVATYREVPDPGTGRSVYLLAQTVTVRKGARFVNGLPAAEAAVRPVGRLAALPGGPTTRPMPAVARMEGAVADRIDRDVEAGRVPPAPPGPAGESGGGDGPPAVWQNIRELANGASETGPLSPVGFLTTIQHSRVVTWAEETIAEADGATTKVYYPKVVDGADLLQPGGTPTFKGVRSEKLADKLDFISLMVALFCGTASLPHILIRYYTVRDGNAARKSTVVGIAAIGFFYVLTLFLGLGAMTSGGIDPTNNNMAAPLLAKSFGELPFAIVSAIAFTTVLGTVSGLIMAASGAVAHDLLTNYFRLPLDDRGKVLAGKVTAVVVGVIAMVLGVLFANLNVSFLVGWAFNVAASANLPALVMLLFWRRTTKQGITAAIVVGLAASLAWILLSGQAYKDVYGIDPARAIVPFSQPGLVTIPLGFAVLVAVSLLTQPKGRAAVAR